MFKEPLFLPPAIQAVQVDSDDDVLGDDDDGDFEETTKNTWGMDVTCYAQGVKNAVLGCQNL